MTVSGLLHWSDSPCLWVALTNPSVHSIILPIQRLDRCLKELKDSRNLQEYSICTFICSNTLYCAAVSILLQIYSERFHYANTFNNNTVERSILQTFVPSEVATRSNLELGSLEGLPSFPGTKTCNICQSLQPASLSGSNLTHHLQPLVYCFSLLTLLPQVCELSDKKRRAAEYPE